VDATTNAEIEPRPDDGTEIEWPIIVSAL